jgi:hypothetical protein
MEDLDKYLKGKMGEEERQRFEEKLAGDPTLQTELELQEGLRQLKWKQKVAQVSVARKQLAKQQFKKLAWYGLALILGVGIILMAYKRFTAEKSVQGKSTTKYPIEKNAPVLEDTQTKQKAPTSKSKPKYLGPIADGGVVDHFDVETGSTMRGVYEELDSLSLQVLDSLIIHTEEVPPLTKNENWNKALQQLIRGKPLLAKSSVFEFEKTDAQEAKWLLALTLLAEGRNEDAIEILRTIAMKPENLRAQVAIYAIDKLKD